MNPSALTLKLNALLAAHKSIANFSGSLNTIPSVANVFGNTPDESELEKNAAKESEKNKITAVPFLELREDEVTTDKHGNTIEYNSKQKEFISLVLSGKSCVLIGAAGTGKTTCIKGAMLALIQSGKIAPITSDHKYIQTNSPGVSISAFTRRATNNIRKNLSLDLQANAVTIHKLLEFEPIFIEVMDESTGEMKKSMRFEPQRNSVHPIPSDITTIVLEEGSMISKELNQLVENASPHKPQFIYLGDIQQLPPVFGSAILGYKMLSLPVVELTEVYRQALDSPIIKLAHRILSGVPIPAKEFPEWNIPGKLKFGKWLKKISPHVATKLLSNMFCGYYTYEGEFKPGLLQVGEYNPETDAILIPFNKACGTDDLNKHIASAIAHKELKSVYEVIHGFKKSYYSVGDKCLYDKEDIIIHSIKVNPEYMGKSPQLDSVDLNYWGNKSDAAMARELAASISSGSPQNQADDVDFILAQMSMDSEEDATVRAASHCIEIYSLDSESYRTIKTTGELNNLILGYAITVHKSQGSEWEKVFFCLHHTHATMMQRELLYTAVTRAKKELVIICEEDSFVKGIETQRIKGNTLEEKAEYFKGKLDKMESQS